jgi:hypothetical protein
MMNADRLLTQEEAAKLAFLVGFLQKSKVAPKPASIDYKLRNEINDLVDARVKKADPNTRLPTKADPPPLIAKG